MTTSRQLEQMVKILNKVTGQPAEAYSKNADGKYVAVPGVFTLGNFNPGDGRRYSIERISNEFGGVSQPFGNRTYTGKECLAVLSAVIEAFEMVKYGHVECKRYSSTGQEAGR